MNSTQQVWRDCPGYEGIYSVSNDGIIRRDIAGKNTHVGKIIKQSKNVGYATVRLCGSDGKRTTMLVHRLLAGAFVHKRDGCDWVNHKDGVKANNDVGNLEWATPAENTKHAIATRLMFKTKNSLYKLTPIAVEKIRWLADNFSCSRKKLSSIYGVGRDRIGQVLRNRSWQPIALT